MKTIKCQNEIIDGKCNRILALLTDNQVDLLRIDAEGGPILRCPRCPPDQRWSRISVDKDGVVVWETLRQEDVGEFPEELKFNDVANCKQVG